MPVKKETYYYFMHSFERATQPELEKVSPEQTKHTSIMTADSHSDKDYANWLHVTQNYFTVFKVTQFVTIT